jgi:hypothetical protein
MSPTTAAGPRPRRAVMRHPWRLLALAPVAGVLADLWTGVFRHALLTAKSGGPGGAAAALVFGFAGVTIAVLLVLAVPAALIAAANRRRARFAAPPARVSERYSGGAR